jgi:hypothetical protein
MIHTAGPKRSRGVNLLIEFGSTYNRIRTGLLWLALHHHVWDVRMYELHQEEVWKSTSAPCLFIHSLVACLISIILPSIYSTNLTIMSPGMDQPVGTSLAMSTCVITQGLGTTGATSGSWREPSTVAPTCMASLRGLSSTTLSGS